MTRPPFQAPTAEDVRTVSLQLGRPARDVVGISARCVCGAPTVVSTQPRLGDGTPFPTFYYLTHPAATAAVSTLEAEGDMPGYTALLTGDVADHYLAAHLQYLADRESVAVVEEIAGISAGGMPDRVKCLHALVAHSLAASPGVNPIGDLALAAAAWSPEVCECQNYDPVTEQAREQATEQARERANEQAREQATGQAREQVTEQAPQFIGGASA